ncbi:LLM class flavin-dependent oxidoreductase [Streptomyces europaeiscabiei]|uniref:LLM class flavin-dependent oxidoreductase n=1 Tax=Streptomyces europaeiscabiei TaxID=146819 RepID=A0AAJ2PMW8_9ACTN|nr:MULTISPECIES: LLM class flavin-dependent oxidoreductase [Streptomyces]KFF97876.1 luciferase [Streptomyces scabiei]MDX3130294.1 LLM class flavin-dependent oxidoreductase [Streptomyces europaeiscabiei]
MKFGINLFPTVGPAEKSAGQHFEESLRLAELADELGFHHVKTVEHYFHDYGGYSPDPVTFLAAAAARTRRIRLVTGAVLPAFTHPLKLAGKLAMLDNISQGRLDVGFGRAFLPDEFTAFEVSMDESRARFDEGVEAVRRLWAEEDVVWEGTFHRFGPVTMLPRTWQRPHPRILVATAKTQASAEAAGRAGYGVMLVPSINPREQVQKTLALYRDAASAAGFKPTEEDIHMSYSCYLAEDGQEAREKGKQASERANQALASAVSAWRETRSADYPGYEKIVEKAGRGDFDRAVTERKALVGTPDEVRAAIDDIRDGFGDFTISLQVISGAMPFEESARTMRLFAEHLLPHYASND